MDKSLKLNISENETKSIVVIHMSTKGQSPTFALVLAAYLGPSPPSPPGQRLLTPWSGGVGRPGQNGP